jgi:hypothetical protein
MNLDHLHQRNTGKIVQKNVKFHKETTTCSKCLQLLHVIFSDAIEVKHTTRASPHDAMSISKNINKSFS